MLVMDLDEDAILDGFDRLTSSGVIVYDDDYRVTTSTHENLFFEFRLLEGFSRKPTVESSAPTDNSTPNDGSDRGTAPANRPGSDISSGGYEICDIGTTHFLSYNKFCAARPHFLLLTQDGFRRQYEAVDLRDLTAAWHVLTSLRKQRYLVLYNCGINAGCSRLHKHLQLFPAPDKEILPLWPDEAVSCTGRNSNVPFEYFLHRIDGDNCSSEEVYGLYQSLLKQAEAAFAREVEDQSPRGQAIPHNVIMDRDWIIVIPRRRAGINGADANAAAMLGMVWVSSEERMQAWIRLGPSNVLREVGIPAKQK